MKEKLDLLLKCLPVEKYSLPTNDLRLGSSWDTWAQKPKSDNFTRPSEASRMESDLMSR